MLAAVVAGWRSPAMQYRPAPIRSRPKPGGDMDSSDGSEGRPFKKNVDSGGEEAFDLIHDPKKWLKDYVTKKDVPEGTTITTTIKNHQHGLRKKIIRVTIADLDQPALKITFDKEEPQEEGGEPIGYKFE
jgi:hypothetical protein